MEYKKDVKNNTANIYGLLLKIMFKKGMKSKLFTKMNYLIYNF